MHLLARAFWLLLTTFYEMIVHWLYHRENILPYKKFVHWLYHREHIHPLYFPLLAFKPISAQTNIHNHKSHLYFPYKPEYVCCLQPLLSRHRKDNKQYHHIFILLQYFTACNNNKPIVFNVREKLICGGVVTQWYAVVCMHSYLCHKSIYNWNLLSSSSSMYNIIVIKYTCFLPFKENHLECCKKIPLVEWNITFLKYLKRKK